MRQTIQWLVVAVATTLPALAVAQEGEETPPNPFEMPSEAGGYGGYGEMGGYPGGGGGYGGGMMGEGYGEMGGYGGGSPPDPFRAGLDRLLDMLREAKSEAEKKQLMEYAREALAKRYKQQLERREAEISDLERRLDALRQEQQRRNDAAERIVDLQMRSLELAAEGLLERDQVITVDSPPERRGRTNRRRGGAGAGYGEMGGGYGMGGGYPGGEAVSPPNEATEESAPSDEPQESGADEKADAEADQE